MNTPHLISAGAEELELSLTKSGEVYTTPLE
jgi:hypothetical protein